MTTRYAQRCVGKGKRLYDVPQHLASLCSGVRIAQQRLHTSAVLESGSNKWSKIRHKKAANDSAKGSFYGSLSREIIACVRQHPQRSADPATNPRLGLLLKKAKDMDVPNAKVAATLQKASSTDVADEKLLTFEAVGPPPKSGAPPVALIIECSTSSVTRTHAKVKEAFAKNNARLSSTAHLFTRTGLIRLQPAEGKQFDDVFDLALEEGAEDVRMYEDNDGLDGIEVVCAPTDLAAISAALASAGHTVHSAIAAMVSSGPRLRFRSSDPAEADQEEEDGEALGYLDEEDVEKLDKLHEFLEAHADATRVWSTLEGWPER